MAATEQSTEKDTVEIEWAVELGFGPCRVATEAKAREWVQSYVDHPDTQDPDDPWPVIVSRTVTTTPWTRVTSSVVGQGGEH